MYTYVCMYKYSLFLLVYFTDVELFGCVVIKEHIKIY